MVSLIAVPYGLGSDKTEKCVIGGKEVKYLVGPNILTKRINSALDNTEEKSIPLYYDYLDSIKKYLEECLVNEKIIEIKNKRLQYCVNFLDESNLTVAIINNGDTAEKFKLKVNTGRIINIKKLGIIDVPKEIRGYYANGKKLNTDGEIEKSKYFVGPKDVKLFRVQLEGHQFKKNDIMITEESPKGKFIALRNISSLKEEILFNITLSHYFCGVKIDAGYLACRDIEALRKEAEYYSPGFG